MSNMLGLPRTVAYLGLPERALPWSRACWHPWKLWETCLPTSLRVAHPAKPFNSGSALDVAPALHGRTAEVSTTTTLRLHSGHHTGPHDDVLVADTAPSRNGRHSGVLGFSIYATERIPAVTLSQCLPSSGSWTSRDHDTGSHKGWTDSKHDA